MSPFLGAATNDETVMHTLQMAHGGRREKRAHLVETLIMTDNTATKETTDTVLLSDPSTGTIAR